MIYLAGDIPPAIGQKHGFSPLAKCCTDFPRSGTCFTFRGEKETHLWRGNKPVKSGWNWRDSSIHVECKLIYVLNPIVWEYCIYIYIYINIHINIYLLVRNVGNFREWSSSSFPSISYGQAIRLILWRWSDSQKKNRRTAMPKWKRSTFFHAVVVQV